MSALGVGIVGCGVISETYLQNLGSFPDVKVVAVSDLIPERARDKAEKHGIEAWGPDHDAVDHPDVELVVNLTPPAVHVEISTAAIDAGKHVWTEKPIGLTRESIDEMLRRADAAGVRVGSAPDTVLGPGVQTAKRAVEAGIIGRPLFAQTAFQTQGPDLWHPAPQFLFAHGGGPLLDMGPYYITALVSLFGPASRVAALGQKARAERRVNAGPDAGATFPVEVPTTMQVLAEFEAGQQAHSLLSFDSPLERHGLIEIHGTEGSLLVPDPNQFTGRTAHLKPLVAFSDGVREEQQWLEIEEEGVVVGRGLGVLDMARALAEDRPHLATGELARHVLDVILSADESASTGAFVTVESTVGPVPAMPVDFDPFAQTR